MVKRKKPLPIWTLILRDGTRHQVEAAITFEIFMGMKKVAPTRIQGNSEVLRRAFSEGEVVLESPIGHQHRVAVEKFGSGWRVIG